jgi:flagellar assembly factor FliW
MNTAVEQPSRKLEVKSENVVKLPLGLLGFENHKDYVMLSRAEETPFLWLQMLEAPHQAFLVVPPSAVTEEYAPELSEEDVDFLQLEDPKEALVFNIVTLRNGAETTVNLKGPIVINRQTLIGKQVIPLNATQYALQHPVTAA